MNKQWWYVVAYIPSIGGRRFIGRVEATLEEMKEYFPKYMIEPGNTFVITGRQKKG